VLSKRYSIVQISSSLLGISSYNQHRQTSLVVSPPAQWAGQLAQKGVKMKKTSRTKTGMFIDTANCRNVDIEQMLRLARRYGAVEVAHAYGNYGWSDLRDVAQQLFLLGVRLIHCPAWHNGSELKSIADETMMSDALSMLDGKSRIRRFILCTGDGHYLPVVCAIKKRGGQVIIMADPARISHVLQDAADKFIPLPAAPKAAGMRPA
jgi:uncharacterized LabA/DUF88 family protein